MGRAPRQQLQLRPRSAGSWRGHRGRAFSCTYEGDGLPPSSPVHERGKAPKALFQSITQHRTLRPHSPVFEQYATQQVAPIFQYRTLRPHPPVFERYATSASANVSSG